MPFSSYRPFQYGHEGPVHPLKVKPELPVVPVQGDHSPWITFRFPHMVFHVAPSVGREYLREAFGFFPVLRGVEMDIKKARRIQRIEQKINRLRRAREKVKTSGRPTKSYSKVCRMVILRIFNWKIVIAKTKRDPLTTQPLSTPVVSFASEEPTSKV